MGKKKLYFQFDVCKIIQNTLKELNLIFYLRASSKSESVYAYIKNPNISLRFSWHDRIQRYTNYLNINQKTQFQFVKDLNQSNSEYIKYVSQFIKEKLQIYNSEVIKNEQN